MPQYRSQIQNMFLSQARKKHQKVELVLETGTVLRGKLKAYDQFSITLGFKDQSEIIYKSSIIYITILPAFRTQSYERRSRSGYSRDDNYSGRDYSRNENPYYYDDDESDERDFEENKRTLDTYRKLGDYSQDGDQNKENFGGYRRDGGYGRDSNDSYRRYSGYRRDSGEGYNPKNRRQKDSNDGYRNDSGYRKKSDNNDPLPPKKTVIRRY